MDAELVKDIESAGGKCMGTTYLQCCEWLSIANIRLFSRRMPVWNGNTVGETAWCQKIADRTNNQVNTAIIGETDMLAPTEQVRAHLKEHMKYPNFRGIRFCVGLNCRRREGRTH